MKMKKLTALCIALLLAGLCALPASAITDEQSGGYAAEILRLVNAERGKQGLAALAAGSDALTSAAQLRAKECAVLFGHTRPNGKQWSTALAEYPVGAYTGAGENIAMGQSSPAQVMQGWMNSPGHRANILGNFTSLGVGVYERNGVLHWAQMFMNNSSGAKKSAQAQQPARFWESWSPALQWMLKWLGFGWLWMRWF